MNKNKDIKKYTQKKLDFSKYNKKEKWHISYYFDLKQKISDNMNSLKKIKDIIYKNRQEMAESYTLKDKIEKDLNDENKKLIEFFEEFYHSNK